MKKKKRIWLRAGIRAGLRAGLRAVKWNSYNPCSLRPKRGCIHAWVDKKSKCAGHWSAKPIRAVYSTELLHLVYPHPKVFCFCFSFWLVLSFFNFLNTFFFLVWNKFHLIPFKRLSLLLQWKVNICKAIETDSFLVCRLHQLMINSGELPPLATLI